MRIYQSPLGENNARMSLAKASPRREDKSESMLLEITTGLGNFSLGSMESRDDTVVSGLTEEEQTMASETGTEINVLRGWLQDFGNRNKSHFEQNNSRPDPASLEKPTRPKVAPTTQLKDPTPLPPPAANAFNRRRISEVKKLCVMSTPVRIKKAAPKATTAVLATNEGYAPVAQLTQWLANDPTSKKKVVQIRRGANVISKSRVFDKGLANVIIEQNHIQTGSVSRKSEMFNGNSKDDVGSLVNSNHGSSVSDKKEWLKNVFQKEKAKSDVLTNKDDYDELTARAKELWRTRTTPMKTNPTSSLARRPRTASKFLPPVRRLSGMPHPTVVTQKGEIVCNIRDPSPGSPQPESGFLNGSSSVASTPTATPRSQRRRNPLADQWEQRTAQKKKEEPSQAQEEPEVELDFQAARRLLVQRSKKNGYDMEIMNKVRLRKNKFEKLEKDRKARQSFHGMLKATWSEDKSESRSSATETSYVKSFSENHPKRKSLGDLP